jgi:hypothetical protein
VHDARLTDAINATEHLVMSTLEILLKSSPSQGAGIPFAPFSWHISAHMASGKNSETQNFFRGAPCCDDIATPMSHNNRLCGNLDYAA